MKPRMWTMKYDLRRMDVGTSAIMYIHVFVLMMVFQTAEALVRLELPKPCKFDGKESYFVGINYADVIMKRFAKVYEPNIECKLHIVESGKNIGVELSWIKFDMEPPVGGVCRDWVQVFKRVPETMKVVEVSGKICGSKAPPNSTQEVNEVIVQVHTSSVQTTHAGFMLQYKKKYVAAAKIGSEPGASEGKNPLENNPPAIAAIAVGSFLVLLLLCLLAICLWCTCTHKDDILRYRKAQQAESESDIYSGNGDSREVYELREVAQQSPAPPARWDSRNRATQNVSPGYWGNRWTHGPWVQNWGR